jgi:hypothetical protein
MMAAIVAKRLVEHLEGEGFVVMQRPLAARRSIATEGNHERPAFHTGLLGS